MRTHDPLPDTKTPRNDCSHNLRLSTCFCHLQKTIVKENKCEPMSYLQIQTISVLYTYF